MAREQIRWVYHDLRLRIPYTVALACTGMYGVPCMIKNKEVRELCFWAIAGAARNKDLDWQG